ncbi:MAG: CPBP family intramembrane metalloprotease [Chloroflexi bacterium]|nr:MAG: CPBP family intramembrane metalloprotease [Chloroflexota bacterium]
MSQVIHRGRLIAWSIFFAWLAIPSYALRLSGRLEVLPVDALFRYSTAVGAIVVDAIQLVLVLVIARKLPFRETFALRRPPSWSRAAAIGVVTIVLAYTVAYLAERLFPDLLREQGIPVYWDGVRAAAWLANLFAIAVFAPLFEESLFRGLGFSLLAPLGVPVAVFVTAVLFTLAHGVIADFPVILVTGLGLGYMRATTGSLFPCIAFHISFNGLGMIASALAAFH